ncbi:MAG: leucyl aminopeptidase [Candidatus Bilamarchaeaceae archaeon]
MKILLAKQFEGDILFYFGFGNELPVEFERFRTDAKSFEGKLCEVYSAPAERAPYSRLAFVSLGPKEEFEPDYLRRAAGTAIRFSKVMKKTDIGFFVPDIAHAAKLLTEGALLADFKFLKLKTKIEEKSINSLTLVSKKDVSEEVRIGRILAECQNYARELGEQPANIMTPKAIAAQALALARKYNLHAKVFDESALRKAGMNALLAVARGSVEEPRFVVLEYKGAKKPFCAVVGKGVTFDSGGISLKPSAKMHEMKYDKSGALAALAVIRAVAELKLPIRIMALLPLAENMPSGTAQHPGDIWTAYNGKTIEVLNTDAEGRLILADALAYAAEQKPDAIIDLATLTGAIIVALGRHAIGMFSNDEQLAKLFQESGHATCERVWPFPLWKEYSEMMKSDYADIKNISDTGEAGSITGAVFLKEFVGDAKWVHLDIAGVANITTSHPYLEKGASGIGVRLLTETFIILSEKGKRI